MNPADLQAMQATIATLAAAVVDMTKLCEGLPKFLETKIAAFRAELNAALHGNSEKLADMTGLLQATQARQAELDGQVVLLGQTIQAGIDATAAELRTITADNRAEIEAHIETRLTETRSGIVEQFTIADGVYTDNLREELQGEIKTATSELETAVNTNRFAAKQQLDEAVNGLNKHLGQVEGGVTVLGQDLMDLRVRSENTDASLAEVRGMADKQVLTTQDLYGKVNILDARADSANKQIGDLFVSLDTVSGAQRLSFENHVTLTARVDEVAQVNQESRESLEKLVATIDTEHKQAREDLQGQITRVGGAIVGTVKGAEERMGEQIGTVRAELGTVQTTLSEQIAHDFTTLSETIEGTAGRVGSLEKAVGEVDTRVSEHAVRLAAVDESLTVVRSEFQSADNALIEGITHRIDKVDERLEGHSTFHKAAHKRTDELEERVSGVAVAVGTVTESLNLVREEFQGADKSMGDTVAERFDRVEGLVTLHGEQIVAVGGEVSDIRERVASFGVSLGNIAEEVKTLDAATNERFNKSADAANEIFGNRFKAVEGALLANTQAVTGIEGRVEEVEGRVAGVDVTVLSVTDEVRTLRTTTDTAIDTAKAGIMLEVKAANDSVAAVSTEVTKLAGTLAEVDERIMQVDVKASATVGEISLVREEMREGFGTVKAAVDVDVKAANDSLNLINGEVTKLAGTVGEVANRVSETVVTVGNVVEDVRNVREHFSNEVGAVREDARKHVAAVVEDLTAVGQRVDKLYEDVGTQYVTLEAKYEGVTDELSAVVAASEAKTLSKVEEGDGRLRAELHTAVEAMAPLAEVRNLDDSVNQRLANVAVNIAEVASIAKGLTGPVAALEERVAAIGATPPPAMSPEQMAELQTRVLAALPDPAPPLPPAELPELSLDTEYEDGALVVRLNYGEGKVASTKVPVELGVRYRGVYKPGDKYTAGDFVSHKGSMWIGKGHPTGAPGEDFTGWQLAVKRGADGKSPDPIRTYTEHKKGNVYRESDFLRANNRLWQCAVKETKAVPDAGEITSTQEWLLIGGVQ